MGYNASNMDEEVKRRADFVKKNVGEGALEILRQHGMDVDGAVNKIIGEQVQEERKRAIEREIPITTNMMTSELVYHSKSLEDIYGKAYVNRLKLIGFNDVQIQSLYQKEDSIISQGRNRFGREQPWAGRYFFMQIMKKDDLPSPDELTLSELILITDDANSAFVRDHHVLSPEAWQAVCVAATTAQYTEAKYAFALRDRAKLYGWSMEQESDYTRNECLILERLKWGYHNNPAWTEKTTKLDLYKK